MMQTTPNERPYQAHEYDTKIRQTIPYSDEIYDQSISMIRRYGNPSGKLLDVGCGAGMFERLLRQNFPAMTIVGIDPAEDMLQQAVQKQVAGVTYHIGTMMDVKEPGAYDMVTALMSHHFIKPGNRKNVLERVYQTLKPGGIYIAFENVIPEDPFLRERELDRWADYQIAAGKTPEEATVHRARCGVFYYPLTPAQHIELLKEAGFDHVYIFWRSYMQMGIMGVKELILGE